MRWTLLLAYLALVSLAALLLVLDQRLFFLYAFVILLSLHHRLAHLRALVNVSQLGIELRLNALVYKHRMVGLDDPTADNLIGDALANRWGHLPIRTGRTLERDWNWIYGDWWPRRAATPRARYRHREA